MLLQDKVAIVTGSSRGIGKGIAIRFAKEGAKVVLCGRGADTHETAAEIRALGGVVHSLICDVTNREEVDTLFDETVRVFGTLDILVNNAQTPTGKGSSGPFLRMTADGWDAYVKANMGALFYCTHRAAQIMCQKRKGSIINISTNATQRVHRRSIGYDSVKGAMDVFTMAVAVDLAPWGVRVNAIRPGMIAASGYEDVTETERRRRTSQIPLGRYGFPEDIAWAAVFFAADDASYVTGQAFQVDGGLLVQGRSPSAELAQPVVTPENIDRLFSPNG
ncbi:MAG: SDR family oxidoreductase [Chloroflexota bacterium]|nr:MAG: SDR family oxidoreductase [Chloroflexota bacterium]